ncbi:MAG TPA: dihydrolipoyllysine-residue acetyltransferase [Candidatus Baltobacteraceae bacterium]
MSDTIEVRVPDIGDFKDISVIELLVKAGDTVEKDDSLIALESDKATMEVPSPAAGTVKDLKVKVGDKVSEGSLVLTLASAAAKVNGAAAAPAPAAAAPAPAAAAAPPAASRSIELTVPDVGDFKDIPVIEILVKPGDTIAKDASLVALESDKATMEVPSSAAGTIESIVVKVGDKVSQGSVIAMLTTSDAPPATSAPTPAPKAQPVRLAPVAQPEPAQRVAAAPAMSGAVHASPSIRRFSRELGVDLAHVNASGPNGRITRDDVQNYVKAAIAGGTGSAGAASGLNLAPWPKIDFAQFGAIERKPLTRIQKLSGPYLHRNWVMIPHVTQNDDADVTDLEEFRKELNAEKSAVKVTMLAFLIKASIAALKEFPAFNSSLDGDELVLKKYYNIGFAADTPNGLVVPVIKNADRKGIAEIAAETSELANKAREGKLGPADMSGGTFTISSLGSIGGTYFTPIINAPEVAILGACRAAIRPVWDGKQFVPRLMQPLSLSYDHRVIDGASAARFTTLLTKLLADMRRALL